MIKTLVVVEDLKHTDSLIGPAANGEERIIFAAEKSIADGLKSRGLAAKTMEDYSLCSQMLWQAGMDWFGGLADSRIENGRNIKELLTHRGLSLWWLIEQPLYVSRFAYPSVMKKIESLVMLEKVISAEKPGRVCFADSGSALAEAVKAVCASRGIDALPARGCGLAGLVIPRLRGIAYIYGQWLRMLARCLCWQFSKQKKVDYVASSKKLLIFSVAVWSNIRDSGGNLRPGEPYLNLVIEKLKDEMAVIDVDVPGGGWGLALMRQKSRQSLMAYRPLEAYLSPRILWKTFIAAIGLRRRYGRLRRSLGGQMQYRRISAWVLLGDNFSLFFSVGYLALMAAYIELAGRMLALEKPSVIVHYGDLPDSGRAVIGLAKAGGIPTILLQHGLYEETSHYFNHSPSDIGPRLEASAPYCPIPDFSIVSDGFTARIFTERGRFPPDSVLVWGQPRYDAIGSGSVSGPGFEPGRKVVVWLTAGHAFSPAENRRYVDSVYQAVALAGARLVIKLHPAESQKAAIYKEHASLKPVIIGRNSLTTLELIGAADAVITNGWCSTGIEAILSGKPVIALDFDGRAAPPYVWCGAALGVRDPQSVAGALSGILHNEDIIRGLAEGRRRFIAAFAPVTDGQATRRFIELVKRMAGGLKDDS